MNIVWKLNDIAQCGSDYNLEVYGSIDDDRMYSPDEVRDMLFEVQQQLARAILDDCEGGE